MDRPANRAERASIGQRGRTRPSWDGLLFGAAGFAPLALAAAVAALAPGARVAAVRLGIAWGGALLSFLAGVRRGLSFDMPHGATAGELAAMLWLFGLAFLALALAIAAPASALAALLAGYASAGALDAVAGRRLEAPRYFAALRPVQAVVALVSLGVLLASTLRSGG